MSVKDKLRHTLIHARTYVATYLYVLVPSPWIVRINQKSYDIYFGHAQERAGISYVTDTGTYDTPTI